MSEVEEVFEKEKHRLAEIDQLIDRGGSDPEEILRAFKELRNDYASLLSVASRLVRHSDRHLGQLRDSKVSLETIAFHDQLTGILNRRGFFRSVEEFSSRAETIQTSAALIMFDLDHFKRVNDTYGHDGGDAVLEHVGEVLMTHVYREASPGRLGGEEFAVFVPDADSTGSLAIAERLRTRFETTSVTSGTSEIRFTASFGIALSPPGVPVDLPALIKVADTALYEAKATGRNKTVISR